ncbi:MAG: class I SAM-dependent methyltransferase [Burkholderiales bacterium]|nr:class I SAM-dependent methyltransferase [Burkholderiales bacterium]MDP2399338.1 class I SAM-dependent methyltransferase [Burkholderiales bacterium]
MPDIDPIAARYLGADYLRDNPSWDSEDSPWKAGKVRELLEGNAIAPASVVDVGCGAGIVLAELQKSWHSARYAGYDIAPDAERFWAAPRARGIELVVGDFLDAATPVYDVLMALDVLEHLQDPFAFLARLKGRANHYVFHFPLDLSAISVLRESPLLHVRRKVGHVHYYTRGLATALLEDCGYHIVDARYTGAAFTAPQRSLKTWLASLPRRVARVVNPDWGVRLFGGETLMVLASCKATD